MTTITTMALRAAVFSRELYHPQANLHSWVKSPNAAVRCSPRSHGRYEGSRNSLSDLWAQSWQVQAEVYVVFWAPEPAISL